MSTWYLVPGTYIYSLICSLRVRVSLWYKRIQDAVGGLLSELKTYCSCRPGSDPFSSFLAMTSISRSAVSFSRLIVLASLDSAGGGFGRALVVSRQGVLRSLFRNNLLRF